MPAAWMRRSVGRVTGGGEPAEMSAVTGRVLALNGLYLPTGDGDDHGQLPGQADSRSLRRHERRPSYTHSAAPVLGPRAVTPGVAANPGPSVNVSSTCVFYCELCSADGSSPWS